MPGHQPALDWLGDPPYDDPDRLLMLAVESAYMEGGVEAGGERLADARADSPDVVDDGFLYVVSDYLSSRGLNDEALSVFDFWVASYPDSVDAYSGRGSHYLEMERLDEALADFREVERLGEGQEGAARTAQWIAELAESIKNPMCMPDHVLERFAGDYGPRHIHLRDHRLYYERDGRQEYALSPVDEFTFRLEGLNYFRIRFVADDEAAATKIVGLYMDGRQDESPRDPPGNGD